MRCRLSDTAKLVAKENNVDDDNVVDTGSAELVTSEEVDELAIVPDEFGSVIMGSVDAIAAFESDWNRSHGVGLAIPSEEQLGGLLKAGQQALKNRVKATRYAPGPTLWDVAGQPKAGTVVTIHETTRDLATGRILSNPQIAAPAVVAAPEILLALAALEMTLEQIADRLEARLEIIEDKVNDILRLASAERLGDVYGHRRVLQRRVREVSTGAQLTNTDWSSIAALGTDLEVGVERLRYHVIQQVTELRPDDSADQRADKLKAAVKKGMLVETLQLLLVAQQSLYLWQKLRLERVRAAEPEYLEQTLDSARTTVREQLDADRDLAANLRTVLDRYSVLRVTEVHRQLAGRTLNKYRAPLENVVDDFISARTLQVDDWLGNEHARFRDAVGAARSQVIAASINGRKQLARGAGKVANWVDPEMTNDVEGGTAASSEAAPTDPNSTDEAPKDATQTH